MKPLYLLSLKTPPKRNLRSFFMVTQRLPNSSSPSLVVVVYDLLPLLLIIVLAQVHSSYHCLRHSCRFFKHLSFCCVVTLCLSHCSCCRSCHNSCRRLPFTWISLVYTSCCHFAVIISKMTIDWFCCHVNLKKYFWCQIEYFIWQIMYVCCNGEKICLKRRLMFIIWQIIDAAENIQCSKKSYFKIALCRNFSWKVKEYSGSKERATVGS